MKILVCDDEQAVCDEFAQVLLEYAEEKSIAIDVDAVYSGKEAEDMLQADEYDLLFLDIEMEGLDGLGLGVKIREVFHDQTVQIIYISARQEYAMQLFQVRPFHFFMKPVTRKDLFHMMDKFMEVRQDLEVLYTYQKKGSIQQCKVKNILYFESLGKKTIIHMLNGKDEFYATLKEVSEDLSGCHFFFCHQSFLAKFENVQAFYPEYLILVNGERLEISQGKRRQVRDLVIK